MGDDWKKLTDKELAEKVNASCGGFGGIVEAMRRLRRSGEALSRWLIVLNCVLVLLTGVLVWLTCVLPLSHP